MNSVHPENPDVVLYRQTLAGAARYGQALMQKLVGATRGSLVDREKSTRDFREREALAQSIELLDKHQVVLCAQYPVALLAAFSGDAPVEKAALVSRELRFDQLELMDEAQVLERVEMARSQQIVMLASDGALADLNTLICGVLGLKNVRPERNPLRPDVYLQALQTVVTELNVATAVRMGWMRCMCVALGHELRVYYSELCQQLQSAGVVAAGYTVVQSPSGGVVRGIREALSSPQGASLPSATGHETPRARDPAFLTLDKLRKLLSGELDQQPLPVLEESFAERFSREFDDVANLPPDAPVSSFHPTVPAAFEALTDMKQVDQIMAQLQGRKNQTPTGNVPGKDEAASVREQLRRSARGLGQALSLEVVTLMIDNIARDPRLLSPVQMVVKGLEPALLHLSMCDPRFFSDKQHPARRLLQEITHRSMAFETEDSPEFSSFMSVLQQAVVPLSDALIENSEPFEVMLQELVQAWDERSLRDRKKIEAAVLALENADARNRLAEQAAQEIAARPDVGDVPDEVIEFLRGPWSQVIAQAKLSAPSGSDDPGAYSALIPRLMWSAQPGLARRNVGELARLVPQMLTTLREGLGTIHYPSAKTGAFFDVLMNLHQLALRPVVQGEQTHSSVTYPATSQRGQLSLRSSEDLWVAPSEAKISGFMELPAADTTEPAPADTTISLGAWVELKVNDNWVRTQLTWVSPHGSLFLFTSTFGSTQSMTRRLRDRLLEQGNLRMISGQPVVDGALDAVAQAAMRNSFDITL